jgi:hypothetical protein
MTSGRHSVVRRAGDLFGLSSFGETTAIMTDELTPSSRALAIARGLVRSGRASEIKATGGYLRVFGTGGDDYWVAFDGGSLRRGAEFAGADELQQGFVEAMERVGATAEPGKGFAL